MEITKTFAENMRRKREEMGLSGEAFGLLCHVTGKHIYDIEKGRKKPSIELIELAARSLNVTVSSLFESEDSLPVKSLPASTMLKKFAAIPDDIYEKAQVFGPEHEVWEEVRATFSDALKDIEEKKRAKA